MSETIPCAEIGSLWRSKRNGEVRKVIERQFFPETDTWCVKIAKPDGKGGRWISVGLTGAPKGWEAEPTVIANTCANCQTPMEALFARLCKTCESAAREDDREG